LKQLFRWLLLRVTARFTHRKRYSIPASTVSCCCHYESFNLWVGASGDDGLPHWRTAREQHSSSTGAQSSGTVNRALQVLESPGDAIVGMRLLSGNRLTIEVIENGDVSIVTLAN
jgi:hypothetical protein